MTLAETLHQEQLTNALNDTTMQEYEEWVCRIIRAGYPYATLNCILGYEKPKDTSLAVVSNSKVELRYFGDKDDPSGLRYATKIMDYFSARGFYVYRLPSGRGCFTYAIVIALDVKKTNLYNPELSFHLPTL